VILFAGNLEDVVALMVTIARHQMFYSARNLKGARDSDVGILEAKGCSFRRSRELVEAHSHFRFSVSKGMVRRGS